jgi:hypothetical protein
MVSLFSMKPALRPILPASLLLLAGLLPVYGCRPEHLEQQADIRGEVRDILVASEKMRGRGIIGFVRIEGSRDSTRRYDRADVTITDTTDIFGEESGSRHAMTFDSIRRGQRIEAFFIGSVLESYPVHATARRVVIVEGK